MFLKPTIPFPKIVSFAITTAMLLLSAACQPSEVTETYATPIPPTATPSPSPTRTPAPTTTPTPTAEPTSAPSPTVEEHVFPPAAMISNISGHKQTYELGCEASAAVDWAGFFGVPIYESTFQFDLPLSDNPELGFVGNVTTDGWWQIPPDAYGVHAPPIAELLREYGLPARAVQGMTIEEVKAELAENNPIIAWVIGNMVYSEPVVYVDQAGNSVVVAPHEHVVILVGYDETSITYMNNGKFYAVPTDVFLTSWGVLGNMAVIYD